MPLKAATRMTGSWVSRKSSNGVLGAWARLTSGAASTDNQPFNGIILNGLRAKGPTPVLFAAIAAVAKAAAHPVRLALLEHVAQGERSVEQLAARARVPLANASQHLQHLRRAGLVSARRQGRFVFYRLADASVLALTAALGRVAEARSAEVRHLVQSYFHDRDSLEAVSRRELLERLQDGVVTVLDLRPEDEFALGHVPGAVNVPLSELAARLAELDPARDIVAYCRGAYCVLSYEAVALLRARGFKARRLEDGLPEWRAAGLPVAIGAAP
jgi:ArsR family transcriptional regulator